MREGAVGCYLPFFCPLDTVPIYHYHGYIRNNER